ncbi:hypothetical protein [Bifidobacterium psychraerophilum]|nr:hypothetical protein [Bifidobacterium psychraerophilum]
MMGNRILATWKSYRAMAVVDRTVLAAAGSVASGIGMAVVKIALGVMTHSLLFIVNAVYYVALCLSRLAIVQQHRRIRGISDSLKRLEREMNVYHRTGLLLCFIGISYAVFSGFMFFVATPTRYTQIVAITVATITAVKIGVAIRGLVVAKRERNPMDSAIKFITFTDALLSLVVVQNVMLQSQRSEHASESSGMLGMGLGIAVIVAGLIMFLRRKIGDDFKQKAIEESEEFTDTHSANTGALKTTGHPADLTLEATKRS